MLNGPNFDTQPAATQVRVLSESVSAQLRLIWDEKTYRLFLESETTVEIFPCCWKSMVRSTAFNKFLLFSISFRSHKRAIKISLKLFLVLYHQWGVHFANDCDIASLKLQTGRETTGHQLNKIINSIRTVPTSWL